EMHCTAVGKSILSFLPEARREAVLQRSLERRTAKTITDPELLRAELARIRQRGVAEDHGENEDFARCIGAPIFDYQGAVIGAVSVSSPQSRLNVERVEQVTSAVLDAAKKITASMGGNWPLVGDTSEEVPA